MQRIVVDSQQILDRIVRLNAEQQHYLHRVLRLGIGDRFIAMDGRGQWWEVECVSGENGALWGRIDRTLEVSTELPVAVTLLAALPKGSGFDDAIRQTTELGVSRIVPVLSQRTLLKPSANKRQRWQRIATEAAEQSERQIVPTICDPMTFAEAIDLVANLQNYICVARGHVPHLKTRLESRRDLSISIGPEGGWTSEEIQTAIDAGFEAVSLGRRILRAVTAPIVALSIVAAVCEDGDRMP